MQRSKLFYATVVFVGTAASIFGKTLTVNSAADAGGSCPGADCTLHQAIATAASGDTINFAPAITTINLTSGELLLNKSLTINGPGANVLSVQRSAAAGNFRIVNISSNQVIAAISGLTIANGNSPSGNSGNGGGIYNSGGTLTVGNSAFSGNSANNAAGGGAMAHGLNGTLNVNTRAISPLTLNRRASTKVRCRC